MIQKTKIADAQAIQNSICFYSEDGKMLFARVGFQVVDKMDLPQKVWNDCHARLHKNNRYETAMSLSLSPRKKFSPSSPRKSPRKKHGDAASKNSAAILYS